jgi:hypothetical protein
MSSRGRGFRRAGLRLHVSQRRACRSGDLYDALLSSVRARDGCRFPERPPFALSRAAAGWTGPWCRPSAIARRRAPGACPLRPDAPRDRAPPSGGRRRGSSRTWPASSQRGCRVPRRLHDHGRGPTGSICWERRGERLRRLPGEAGRPGRGTIEACTGRRSPPRPSHPRWVEAVHQARQATGATSRWRGPVVGPTLTRTAPNSQSGSGCSGHLTFGVRTEPGPALGPASGDAGPSRESRARACGRSRGGGAAGDLAPQTRARPC